MNIVISSGHGKYVRGASGYIDEVDEARDVVDKVADLLDTAGIGVVTFHDDVSQSQSENLDRIVDFHNAQTRDLDVSVHFNAYETTSKPMGCEVLYVSSTGMEIADRVVDAVCAASGLINRGPKKRTDLAFLNGTEEPAILIETCFVDSKADVDLYDAKFDIICQAIADSIAGEAAQPGPEPVPPADLPAAFDQATIDAITEVAINSDIAGYEWKDRGQAPPGYIMGMALAFGMAVKRFQADDQAALEMAKANTGNDDLDALSWYDSNFKSLGMSNATAGIDTLRHLYVLMLGLGMRESSGQHCEGRDQSASNVESDTCEAGLLQTSWNIHTCSDEIDRLFEQYEPSLNGDLPQCYLPIFAEGVSCSQSSWSCYGSGDGRDYQEMSKKCPPFHIEVTGIGLRNRRQHWGPINNKAAELRKDADDMLKAVQDIVLQQAPEPPVTSAEVDITITGHGPVRVTINGQVMVFD